jgi:hypothetical protein
MRTSREIEREAVTEDAELLAARLEVERLRAVVEDAASDPAACVDTVADLRAALSAPPPDLGPLRELVAAGQNLQDFIRCDHLDMAGARACRYSLRRFAPGGRSAGEAVARHDAACDALLAAYPCLGEPGCE